MEEYNIHEATKKFRESEDKLDFIKEVFETGNIASLITGEGKYVVPENRYSSSMAPTDYEYILRVLITRYYMKTLDYTIIEKLKKALIAVLNSKDAKNVWCAYDMLSYQMQMEADGSAKFKLIDDNLIEITRNALLENKSELEKCFLYDGGFYKNGKGLWESIERTERFLLKQYGKNFQINSL